LDLSRKTGASIVYGPTASPSFRAIIAKDNEVFTLGKVKIRVIHTPGHTMESSCYLLLDENGKEHAIFTGDTLFLGDVGRPDLAQKAANMTQEELAGLLYESLYNKILLLPDDIIVYPGHGAGSACGKNMMKETVDTLGNQKKLNYALNQPSKEAFIKAVTEGLTPPPGYFGMNVAMNKTGYESIDKVLEKGKKPLDVAEFESIMQQSGILVLDTRPDTQFANGFIPGSINIGLAGDFAPWVGALIVDVNQPILLVAEPGKEEEAIIRLSRVGFDNVLGYLKGGFDSWKEAGKPVDRINRISAKEFVEKHLSGKIKILDVRKESEYAAGHLDGAVNKPLQYINEWTNEVKDGNPFYLHCAGGYRSMIAASILQTRGIRNFTEIEGGYNAISRLMSETKV
jgi:rhodanese-related sulfurtransferase